MALTDEQLEIISEALLPLFQYLEKEVIIDVANRIKKSLAYTRTAELKAESMQRMGYSPVQIRKEALKLLNADAEFQKMVAQNTREHKKAVKRLLKEIYEQALKEKDTVLAESANTAFQNDVDVWEQGGKESTVSVDLDVFLVRDGSWPFQQPLWPTYGDCANQS